MNKREIFKNLLLILLLTTVFTSCLTNVEDEEEDNTMDDPCATITYALNIKPIMDGSCIQCHSTNGGQFPNLETYAGVKANASKVKSEIVSGDMPLGGTLTTAEIDAVKCWVDNGALNN